MTEASDAAWWAAREEQIRIAVALVRGEVKILGKPVTVFWPEGQPLHLDEMINRLAAQ